MKTTTLLASAALAALSLAAPLAAKDYSGAELYTQAPQTYGKFEARMKMAAGSGIVDSMLLYHNDSYLGGSEPWCEVDIEILGKAPNRFASQIVTGTAENKVTSESYHAVSPAADQAFHTYALEWTPDYVAWLLDGTVVHKIVKGQGDNGQVEAVAVKPMGLRFKLWSHEDAGWVGAWNDNILPVYHFVNWVKVYSYTPGQGENGGDFTLDWTDNFDSFDSGRWDKGDWTEDGNRVDITPAAIVVTNGMAVLGLTKKGQEGFSGTVPSDDVFITSLSRTSDGLSITLDAPVSTLYISTNYRTWTPLTDSLSITGTTATFDDSAYPHYYLSTTPP